MDILQETIPMLLLKIYPSLYGGVVFLNSDRWQLYNIVWQTIPSIDDPATKEVLPNISRTELFIEFKIITTCVPTCIVNRKRYVAPSMYHFVAQN